MFHSIFSVECVAEGFGLVHRREDGLSSTCFQLEVIQDVTLQQCKENACEQQANVFNFLGNRCEIRKCFSTDMELSNEWGGKEIYVLTSEYIILSAFLIYLICPTQQ